MPGKEDKAMGLFSDLYNAIAGEGGSKVSSEPKTSSTVNDNGDAHVRNSDVVVNHNSGGHDTMWSNTHVDGSTGETKYDEGAHGPNFK